MFEKKLERVEIVHILKNFLSFNPFFRMSAFECLTKCKVFDSVRDIKKEKALEKMKGSKQF
jgi:hypothetical protein